MDGAARTLIEMTGIIRDHRGQIIRGEMKDAEICSAEEAEAWALLIGLKLAQSHLSQTVFIGDCLSIAKW